MYTQILEGSIWLVYAMNRGGLVCTTIKETDLVNNGMNVHDYLKDLWHGSVYLEVWGAVAPQVEIPRRAPFTCVELARSLLGIDQMLYTPWQLYTYLVDNRLWKQP